jgi:hypothetical protein
MYNTLADGESLEIGHDRFFPNPLKLTERDFPFTLFVLIPFTLFVLKQPL